MRRLKRFTQLTATEKRILLRVLVVVGVARTALCVLSTEQGPQGDSPGRRRRLWIARANGVGG